MHEPRRDASQGHVLIGGTGRAGTTLLVQYFTVLGFDTGYSVDRARAAVDPVSSAGLEHSLSRTLHRGKSLPYVAKSPYFGANLDEPLTDGRLRVRHFIMPIRDLGDAAASRRRVSQAVGHEQRTGHRHPGGQASPGTAPRHQEKMLAVKEHHLLLTLARHHVPVLLLPFPDFAQDPDLVFAHLQPLLEAHGVSEAESREAMRTVADPSLIHTFPAPADGAPRTPLV